MSKALFVSQDAGGTNATEPVRQELKDRGWDAVRVDASAIGDYADADSVLFNHIPDLVVTGTSVQTQEKRNVPDQIMTAGAQVEGVPSIAVLDLWQNYVERFSDLWVKGEYSPKFTASRRFAFMPDKIAVMDILANNRMVEGGFDSKRLAVTGNPHFDTLPGVQSAYTEAQRQELREHFRVRDDQELYVFASQPIKTVFGNKYGFDEHDALRTYLEGLSLVGGEGERVILVKPHPSSKREDPRALEAIAAEFPKEGVIVYPGTDYNTQKAVLSSDFTATPFSTTFYEALVWGKPVVAVQPGVTDANARQLATHEFRNIVPICETPEDVTRAVSILKSSDKLQYQMMQEQNLLPRGDAAEKIADLAESMVEKR